MYIYVNMRMDSLFIISDLIVKAVTPSEYINTMCRDINYAQFFNSGNTAYEKSMFLILLCKYFTIILIPFNFSYQTKHIILEIPFFVIWIYNTYSFMDYDLAFLDMINSREETTILQQLLSTIQKCKKRQYKYKYSPEEETEIQNLVNHLSEKFPQFTIMVPKIQTDLDMIHSVNLILSQQQR